MLFAIDELKKLCKPVVEFLKENYDPYTKVIISQDCIKMVQNETGIPMNEEED